MFSFMKGKYYYNKYIHLYKGKYVHKIANVDTLELNGLLTQPPKRNKVIVFDLDETLGSFGEFYYIWTCLEQINTKYKLNINFTQEIFNELLELFPEFLRYGILTILDFLNTKKNACQCYKIYVYTNNIGSPHWPGMIRHYFDYKLKSINFFDHVICAFKVNNVIVEPLRTTHEKTYQDFIRCSLLPKNTEICFVDDSYYHKMATEKIYYIQPKPYFHGLTSSQIFQRLIHSPFVENNILCSHPPNIVEDIHDNIMRVLLSKCKTCITKDIEELERDIVVTQKIMYYLKEFFYLTTRKMKTRKNNIPIGRFTRKKKYN